MNISSSKVVVLQRFIPSYRVAVFKEIVRQAPFNITYVIGKNVDGLKAQNAKNLSGLNYMMLRSKGITIFGRTLVWHFGLLRALFRLNPKVIVCEAESHVLGYLIAILYKIFRLGQPQLILWCFFVLPGQENRRSFLGRILRKIIRYFFSGFISYAALGKQYLISQGVAPSHIFIANNVCDTQAFLERANSLKITQHEAKINLGLAGKFIVSYVGTLDPVKRPDLLVELAEIEDLQNIHFCIVGTGHMERQLRKTAEDKKLENITITGRISDGLDLYYRASDLVILPGRGGIVISESMCFSTPVMAFQGDGTEIDLLQNNETGYLLTSGEMQCFAEHIKILSKDAEKCTLVGSRGHNLILNNLNTNNMALAFVNSLHFVMTKP